MNLADLWRWRPGGLAKASTELLGWFLLRAAAQGVVILVMARALGASDYGALVAVVAMSGILGGLSGLGLPSVLLRDGARSAGELPRLLSATLSIWWRSTLLFSVLGAVIAHLILPKIAVPILLVHGVIVAEIASVSLLELVGRAFQARQHTRAYGALQAGLPLARLAIILCLIAVDHRDFSTWLWAYMLVTLVYVLATLLLARKAIGWNRPADACWPLIRDGIPFTISGFSVRLQAEYNKPLLAQAAFAQAGQFNIAQRAVDLISLPLLAVQEALWPRLYSDRDHRGRLAVAGTALMLMSLAGATIVIAASRFVPRLLGEDYASVADLMVLLAGVPVLASLRGLANFQLIATHRTHLLIWVYMTSAAVSAILATILIPRHALTGAAWACYAGEVTALLCLFAFLAKKNR